jgi:hypothetical protein
MKSPYDISWNGKQYPKGSDIDNAELIAALGGDQSEEKPEDKPKAKSPAKD